MAKAKISDDDYPSNSRSSQLAPIRPETTGEEPKVERQRQRRERPVQAVLKSKRTLAQSIASVFAGETGRNVRDFALHDVFLPALKSTVQELVTSTLEMLFNGGEYKPRERSDNRPGRVSYERFYDEGRRDARPSRSRSKRFNVDDVSFRDHNDAEDVLEEMCEDIEDYGQVTVKAFFEYAGVSSGDWVANNWGWTDLSQAYCTWTRGGWQIVMPDPIDLRRQRER